MYVVAAEPLRVVVRVYECSMAAQGYESPEEQVGIWNLKSQVKNRYRMMRRMEDDVMSS
uniref:Uncharacterized protein n=1 Tax=Zea mays TaxID=4577 RepID=B6T0F8_MAIZE|nr:hypothetical protein [Zea mays]